MTSTFIWNVTGITIDQLPLRADQVGANVSLPVHAVDATGGTLSYSATGLPAGLSIDPATGIISGTVANIVGNHQTLNVDITASSGTDHTDMAFKWSVVQAGVVDQIVVVNPGQQSSIEGTDISEALHVASSLGLPVSVSVTGLPPGLSVVSSTSSGTIQFGISGHLPSGDAANSPYTVHLSVTDGYASGSSTFVWKVSQPGGDLSWQSAASMPLTRNGDVAVRAANGNVYVLGGGVAVGTGGNRYAEVDAYNPSSDSWSHLTDLPAVRSDFGATVGQDGRLYVFSGFDANSNYSTDALAYNPSSGTWSTLAPMPDARFDFQAITGTDGRIYVIGGLASDFSTPTRVDIYNPATNQWTQGGNMHMGRANFGAALGADGKIYVFGGNDLGGNGSGIITAEVYDPSSGTWTNLPSLASATANPAVTTGSDGRIYILGGSQNNHAITTALAFDPTTHAYSALPTLPAAVTQAAAALAGNGQIYLFGGTDTPNFRNHPVNSVETLTSGSTQPPPVLTGDLNQDGVVDMKDVTLLMSALANLADFQTQLGLSDQQLKKIVDANGDGKINGADIQAMICLVANAAQGSGGATPDAISGNLLTDPSAGVADPTVAATSIAIAASSANTANTASSVTAVISNLTAVLTPSVSVQVASADLVESTSLPLQPDVKPTDMEPTVTAISNVVSGTPSSSSLPEMLLHVATAHDLTITEVQPDFDVALRSLSFNLPSTPSNVAHMPGSPEPSSMVFLNRIDRLFSSDDADLLPTPMGSLDAPRTIEIDTHFSELDWVAGP